MGVEFLSAMGGVFVRMGGGFLSAGFFVRGVFCPVGFLSAGFFVRIPLGTCNAPYSTEKQCRIG